ncbi:hypothetical protein MAR_032132 [Mya arenaria]|uniref:Uncharacterized protein n=1 Tax=Mya arenaria TaxID=6604 RepID=A0ABY7F5R3_MYAAR|nr:hypothetical protein MAR_032132 [Mya arenaria]
MIVTLPTDRQKKITGACYNLSCKIWASIRKVAQVIGMLVASFSAVELGKMHYRHLEKRKTEGLKKHKGNYDAIMYINLPMKQELSLWIDNIHLQYRKICRPYPTKILETDASLQGWGAKLGMQKNWRPLDNSRETRSYQRLRIAGNFIWEWCVQHDIWLTCSHKAGKLNLEADKESRAFKDNLEWKLDGNIIKHICNTWGVSDIDLFASRLNSQIPRYCSWKPDPECECVDAFRFAWNAYLFYAFPPFSLLGRCVQKIKRDMSKGIIVAPLWPTQPWFTRLIEILMDFPIIIKKRKGLLILPHQDVQHPLEQTLRLVVCKVSGRTSDTEDFQRKLPIFSCNLGDQGLRNNITRIYCSERETSPILPTLETVVECLSSFVFLTCQYSKGLGYESLNTARGALSALGLQFDGFRVGNHPLIIRYMKGVFASRPSKPRYTYIWDVDKVLLNFEASNAYGLDSSCTCTYVTVVEL